MIDPLNGNIYGMIIAAAPEARESYMIPAHKIYDSIKAMLPKGTAVGFPSNNISGNTRSLPLLQATRYENEPSQQPTSRVLALDRRVSKGEITPPKSYELYHFEKKGDDWTFADKTRTYVSQEELESTVSKSKIRVTEQLQVMRYPRRGHISKLLEYKNKAERGSEWYVAHIEAQKTRGGKVPTMDVIIAHAVRLRPRDKQDERSAPTKSNEVAAKDKTREKDEITYYARPGEDYLGNQELFTRDGRPIPEPGTSTTDTFARDGRPSSFFAPDPLRSVPLLPLTPASTGVWNNASPAPVSDSWSNSFSAPTTGGWFDSSPAQLSLDTNNQFPFFTSASQVPTRAIEILPSGRNDGVLDLGNIMDDTYWSHGHGNVLDLDNILDDRPRSQHADKSPDIEDLLPIRRSARSKPARIYHEEPRRRSYTEDSRKKKYGQSSSGSAATEASVFSHETSKSSMSSYDEDHQVSRRYEHSIDDGFRPSRRHAPMYREHSRGTSYNLDTRGSRSRDVEDEDDDDFVVYEPGRASRRSGSDRRHSVEYSEPLQKMHSRDDTHSPPHGIHRSYSPSRRPPPEVYYPNELKRSSDSEKDREAVEYSRDLRYRDDELIRHEREPDDRDYRRSSYDGPGKLVYGEKRYYRDSPRPRNYSADDLR